MSTLTAYLPYMIEVILNSIAFAVGMIISVATPVVIQQGLSTVSNRNRQSPPNDVDVNESDDRSSMSFRDGILVFIIMVTTSAYPGLVCYFWRQLDSILQAVIKSTITIIGTSVGLAIPALILVYIDRAIG